MWLILYQVKKGIKHSLEYDLTKCTVSEIEVYNVPNSFSPYSLQLAFCQQLKPNIRFVYFSKYLLCNTSVLETAVNCLLVYYAKYEPFGKCLHKTQ